MKMRIALLQLLPGDSLEKQFEIGKVACRKAKEMNADIALFPEMWSDGYYIPQDASELERLAVSKESSFVQEFGKLAANLQMAIGITFLEKNELKPLNSIVLFERMGKEQLHYSKVHTCDFDA